MTKVNELIECHKCSTTLPDPKPKFCPTCSTCLLEPKSEFFARPDYLSYQLTDKMIELTNKDGEMSIENSNKLAEVQEDLIKWFRTSVHQDAVCSLMDSHGYMKSILHSNFTGAEITEVLSKAKAIGELAVSIEKYLKVGGEAHVRRFDRIPADEGDSRGGAATAGGNRDRS